MFFFSFIQRLDVMTTVEVATKLDQSPDSKPPYPIWVEPGLLVGSFVCYCFAIEYTAFLIPMVLLFFSTCLLRFTDCCIALRWTESTASTSPLCPFFCYRWP